MTPGRGFRWVRVRERLRLGDLWYQDLLGRWIGTTQRGKVLTKDQNKSFGPYRRRTRPHPARNKRKERG